ncbi:nucleotidyltransferase domain-containing protein [Geobacillus stearothermophilus]|nr:nucleotidyltransferase domain-containing protein [Geobacillus stearothermophilus]
MEEKVWCEADRVIWLVQSGEQRESSDIDVLVEFMDNAVTFDHYMELKLSLEDHFQKPVDLVIVDDIKPGLKPTILRSVKYAEGS